MGEQLLTVTDVCQRLKLSRTQIYHMRKSDKTFPEPLRFGRALRWRASDVDDYLAQTGSRAAQAPAGGEGDTQTAGA